MSKPNILFAVSLLLLLFVSSCSSKKLVTKQGDVPQEATVTAGQVEDHFISLQTKYLEGVYFFASGNEPYWSLEIHGDYRIDFKTLGPEEDSIKVPMSVVAELKKDENITYQAETSDGDFVVKLQREKCQDSMSGKELPYTVEVQYKNILYQGCGNYLSDSRLQGTWTLEQLSGKEVTIEKKPFLNFSLADNKVSGNTGCNRITGTLEPIGDKINLGPIAATKMACPNMDVESQILSLLNEDDLRYKVSDKQLELKLMGKVVMVFEREE